MRATIYICTRDRGSELALLLQSLRTQTWQDWDVLIVDGSRPNICVTQHHIASVINRMKLEGHAVHVEQALVPGVCYARQRAIETDPWPQNELIVRLDDDVILTPMYLEKLYDGIMHGYDLMSGLTIHCANPDIMREVRFVQPIMNKIMMSPEGDLLSLGDDCAHTYGVEQIIPIHHFRSCAMYKRALHTVHGAHYKLGLTNVGFREETFISIRAILAGYKLGVHTGAINHHLQTPSGGCRFQDYNKLCASDDAKFREWLKAKVVEHGDFITKYNEQVLHAGH